MTFKPSGKNLKRAIAEKPRVIKFAVALLFSNLFFFLLFGENAPESEEPPMVAGAVALHLEARVRTPLRPGMRVLIVNHARREKVEASYRSGNEDGRVTVEVPEEEAPLLLRGSDWEILPLIRNLAFQNRPSGVSHEIRY